MKFGYVSSYGTPREMVETAKVVEESGWDAVFTWDAICVGPNPVYEPWAMLAAMSMETERVQLGAMIFALARRKPWEVVRQALTVDHLSGGRVIIPVALGVPEDGGFSKVNTDVEDRKGRAERLDECLEYMTEAWAGEPFSFAGTHYQAGDMVFNPRPVHGAMPIWCVGRWPAEKSLKRALKYDGLIISTGAGDPTPDEVADVVAWVNDHRESDAPFDIVLEGRTEPDDASATLQPYADAGATWWIESRWHDTDTPESLKARAKAGPPTLR